MGKKIEGKLNVASSNFHLTFLCEFMTTCFVSGVLRHGTPYRSQKLCKSLDSSTRRTRFMGLKTEEKPRVERGPLRPAAYEIFVTPGRKWEGLKKVLRMDMFFFGVRVF